MAHARPQPAASKAPTGEEQEARERELQQRLGYAFQRPELLRQALTHRSRRREMLEQAERQAPESSESRLGAWADNERFELLGDAVVGLRVCERLLESYPTSSEGQLSRLRAWVVSARSLGAAAARLGLGACLRLSRAEAAIGGHAKPRLLANAMEAVLAAIYVDGGYGAAAGCIDRHLLDPCLEHLAPGQLHEFAYKSALQEWAHAAGRPAPVYRVLSASGPDHDKIFTVEVALPEAFAASGSSKKAAEQRAAAAALEHLGVLPAGASRLPTARLDSDG